MGEALSRTQLTPAPRQQCDRICIRANLSPRGLVTHSSCLCKSSHSKDESVHFLSSSLSVVLRHHRLLPPFRTQFSAAEPFSHYTLHLMPTFLLGGGMEEATKSSKVGSPNACWAGCPKNTGVTRNRVYKSYQATLLPEEFRRSFHRGRMNG